MPKTLRVFQVFVASPSDLQPEREALETTIAELNQTIGSTLGIRLDLVRWETSTHPSMGADPQTIITEQLGADFDIFIGILWCRLGQPTPRAESGTVEEFDRALARRHADPSAIEVMVYFKDAPIPPSRIDPLQLQKVHAFRARAEQEGLTGTFSSTDEFLTAVRIHLTRVLQGWDTRSGGGPVHAELQIEDELAPPVEDEEPGFLDLIEASTENFGLTSSASERITSSISELGVATQEATARLEGTDYSTQAGIAHAKRTVNSLADRMSHFSANLRSDIPVLRDTFGKAISSMQSAAGLLPDFQGDPSTQLNGSIQVLGTLEAAIQATRENIEEFRHKVEGTPRMSTQFNRAKRGTSEALEQLESTFNEQLRLVSEARKLQEVLLQQYRGDA
jgi:hypothetical protein